MKSLNFWGFPKSGMKFLSPNYFSNFFEKNLKIIWREKSSPDFGNPQKFNDFIFFSPEFERSC